MNSIAELHAIGFPRIAYASIGVTTRCNLLCRHCIYSEEARAVRPRFMDPARLAALIPQIVRSGCRVVSIIGGEPLLHPEIRSIIRLCRKAGLDVTLYTNGTLLDEGLARFLRTSLIQVAIITLYGASAEEYRDLSVAKEGHLFPSLRSGIALIKSFGIPYRLQVFSNRFQPGLYERIKDLFPGEKLIARGWKVIPRSPLDNENQRCMLDVEEGIKFPDDPSYPSLHPLLPLRRLLYEKKAVCDCAAGIAKVHIEPDFTVTPCMYVRDARYAFSLDSHSFKEIVTEKMCAVATRQLSKRSLCYDCKLRLDCKRCIAMGYGATDADSSNWTQLCRITQALAKTGNRDSHGSGLYS